MIGKRGLEIRSWLNQKGMKRSTYADNKKFLIPDYNFIILDDETKDIQNYFTDQYIVKLDCNNGLTYLKTKEAIEKLLY